MRKWIFEIRSRPFILLGLGFFLVTVLVLSGAADPGDRMASDYFHSVAGNAAIDLSMWFATETGDLYYMLFFGVGLLIIRKTRRIGLTLLICLVLTTLATGYLKCGVTRDAPGMDFAGVEFPIASSADTFPLFCSGSYSSSYPSGHAARAAAFGLVLGFSLSERFPRGCYLLLLYPAFVSLSRVYVIQHYPMDIAGGIILGFLIAGAIGHRSKLYRVLKSQL